jgi:hypothetical protein
LDGVALKAALIYVENSISGGSTVGAPIPFPVGSKAWCFAILILYKPWRSLYTEGQQPLLLPHQSAKDALIENGMICANCLVLGGGLLEIASIDVPSLKRCGSCQLCWYCSEKCQKQHWKIEHKDRCNNKHCDCLFVVGDDEERNFREFLVQEMLASQQYIEKHPFPEYKRTFLLYQFLLLQRKEGLQVQIDSRTGTKSIYSRLIWAYTRGVHDQLESVYESLGKNSFEAKAIALGEYLHQVGGVEFMEMIYEIMVHQFGSKMDERNKEDKVDSKAATGDVGTTALRQLGSSWDYIESWEERRTKEKPKMEIEEEEETEETTEKFGSYNEGEDVGVCAAE